MGVVLEARTCAFKVALNLLALEITIESDLWPITITILFMSSNNVCLVGASDRKEPTPPVLLFSDTVLWVAFALLNCYVSSWGYVLRWRRDTSTTDIISFASASAFAEVGAGRDCSQSVAMCCVIATATIADKWFSK